MGRGRRRKRSGEGCIKPGGQTLNPQSQPKAFRRERTSLTCLMLCSHPATPIHWRSASGDPQHSPAGAQHSVASQNSTAAKHTGASQNSTGAQHSVASQSSTGAQPSVASQNSTAAQHAVASLSYAGAQDSVASLSSAGAPNGHVPGPALAEGREVDISIVK